MSAVTGYLNTINPDLPAAVWNSTGISRAYPDVSVAGIGYPGVVNGMWYAISGTSASAPVFAAMISLVNDARMAAGKGPVGFINPAVSPIQLIQYVR